MSTAEIGGGISTHVGYVLAVNADCRTSIRFRSKIIDPAGVVPRGGAGWAELPTGWESRAIAKAVFIHRHARATCRSARECSAAGFLTCRGDLFRGASLLSPCLDGARITASRPTAGSVVGSIECVVGAERGRRGHYVLDGADAGRLHRGFGERRAKICVGYVVEAGLRSHAPGQCGGTRCLEAGGGRHALRRRQSDARGGRLATAKRIAGSSIVCGLATIAWPLPDGSSLTIGRKWPKQAPRNGGAGRSKNDRSVDVPAYAGGQHRAAVVFRAPGMLRPTASRRTR